VKKKGPRDTSPIPTKVDFVKRSLNATGISVSDTQIWTVLDDPLDDPLVDLLEDLLDEDPLDEGYEGRVTRQAVLGIFLALALHHFPTKKGYWARAMLIKKAVFGDTPRRHEDRIHEWLEIAAAEVVRH
jgi:hypothetical protein